MISYERKSRDWVVPFAPGLSFPGLETPYFRAYAQGSDAITQIRLAADLGFRAVFDSYLVLRKPDEQARIGEELARQGMVNAGIIFAPDTMRKPLWSASAAADIGNLETHLRESIAAAKRGGSRQLCVLTARTRFLPGGQQIYAFAANLKRFLPVLEENGIELCIEAACPELAPAALVQRLTDAYTIVKSVDSPAVSLMFDVYHINMTEGDVLGCLRWVVDRVGAVQLSDTARLEPGSGAFNVPNIILTALRGGYRRPFELEHLFSEKGSDGLALALQRLEAIDRTVGDALAVAGSASDTGS